LDSIGARGGKVHTKGALNPEVQQGGGAKGRVTMLKG